jgi:hypothetical protein
MKPADRLRELADWFDVDAHGHMSWETKQARAADIRAVLEALSRAEGALERLGSTEAFDVARAIDPERDAELLARIDFARAALDGASDA